MKMLTIHRPTVPRTESDSAGARRVKLRSHGQCAAATPHISESTRTKPQPFVMVRDLDLCSTDDPVAACVEYLGTELWAQLVGDAAMIESMARELVASSSPPRPSVLPKTRPSSRPKRDRPTLTTPNDDRG
jgi:hypothetical protein